MVKRSLVDSKFLKVKPTLMIKATKIEKRKPDDYQSVGCSALNLSSFVYIQGNNSLLEFPTKKYIVSVEHIGAILL